MQEILLHVDAFLEKGIRIPRGVALCGKPGIGKTVLARSMACEGIALAELRAADCCSGELEARIRSVFQEAREKAPAIILLDELDKIAETSEEFHMESNDKVKKILLQEMDALADVPGVMVVATCNRTGGLGEALLRPGRFDRVISMPLPEDTTRKLILEEYASRLSLRTDFSMESVARQTFGYTGAELECIVNEAGIHAVMAGRDAVNAEDIRIVMDRLEFHSYEREVPKDAEALRRTAVHEAGHAVVALVLSPESVLDASVLPQGDCEGHIRRVGSENIESIAQAEDDIAILLAGRAAEKMVDGTFYLGSSSDLGRGARRLRDLMITHGAYGYRYMLSDMDPFYSYGDSDFGREAMCTFFEEKMNELEAKALGILQKHRASFDRIAQALMERHTLTEAQLKELMGQ